MQDCWSRALKEEEERCTLVIELKFGISFVIRRRRFSGWSLREVKVEEEEYRLWESALGVGRSRKLPQGGGWNRALKEEVVTRRKDAQVTWEMHWIISIRLCCVGWK